MKITGLVCAATLLLISARVAAVELGCEDPREPRIEAKLMRELANGAAHRVSRHRLRIQTKSGAVEFVDQPPHNDFLDGVHYYFCDRKEGFTLLLVIDKEVFTGVLINEATGRSTPAGETVLFSQDRRAYLATEQPSGLEGEVWKVYSADGRLSWSGYSFILADSTAFEADADLQDPVWSARGELTATASCIRNTERKWQVTLIKDAGAWEWRPKPSSRCSRALPP